jgi:histidyl-tRNA synthetase
VAENFQNLALPYRSYRYGWVFRNEKPGPGRFRQFMQFDADTVGAPTMAADAEMCMLAADTMEELGIKRGDYVVKVSNRKVLDGLRESLSVVAPISEAEWLTVMRAIDKLDRVGIQGVFQLLTNGRKDESGDFTKGAGLSDAQADNAMRFLGFSQDVTTGVAVYKIDRLLGEIAIDNKARLDWFEENVELGPTGKAGVQELRDIAAFAKSAGFDESRILVDRSVVRGLEYYTGPVYEVELTFEIKDEKGRPVRFGSVGGGGRYDGLVSRFMGQPVPATGFSIGVSRLQAALTALGKLGAKRESGPVLVTVFGAENVQASQKLTADLRTAGIRAELYLGNPKHGIGQQLKYADRRGSPCAVIQGPDENAKGEVQIRDLIAGAAPSDLKDRDAYLKKQSEAQVAVKEGELVEAVRKLLARHKLS